ncbi:hypothetical protein CRM94_15230 [Burkholderia gladioli]|uniref:Uncharacterized protein n=1 Tax=Burkholderia gladioli TaxID=28095 RepID=A0A2A7SJD4_BURGA|nr:hypothetical protein CO712_26745 [Burkholderia gladioli pv. gladioli]PEH43390.1 hypothetical protein CRM94_15230 [Burkholderia gladioli]
MSGASYSRVTTELESGSGRARRSSLPLVVSGKASSTTKALGTMCSASDSASFARSSAVDSALPAWRTR